MNPESATPSEKLVLLKDYLEQTAPRPVSREEIMQRFGLGRRSFYRYMGRLERLGVPLVWLVRYEVTVLGTNCD